MGLQALNDSISGLQADSAWLDVIGNNISNVNTVAYKSSRVEFADLFSQTLESGNGDNPSSNLGGVNPQQVGLGTRLASITSIFSEGAIQTTGITTDIALQGDGFLVSKQGNQTYLTRAGNLTFDGDGYLVDQNGGKIQGFTAAAQYTQKVIHSDSSVAGQPAVITDASLVLDNSNLSEVGDIRIDPDMTLPPKATTQVNFQGNLDSFQQPNVLDLATINGPVLPVGDDLVKNPIGSNNAIDTTRMTDQLNPAGTALELKQVANLSIPSPGTDIAVPLENFYEDLNAVRADDFGTYAWEQQPPIPPACQVSETVYDSLGNQRQITVQFYQVNDLGSANPPINPSPGPSQVCYAWYAFETTGGQQPTTQDLLGGTGINDGNPLPLYDRGNPILNYNGDFLWFNTDGSLASSGGMGGIVNTPAGYPNNFMVMPRIYLMPNNQDPPVSPVPTIGAQITAVDLNFGTWGILGVGQRDGVFSDAEGSYQTVNGVNTYVPKHTIYAASQNGYQDGSLQGLNFDASGTIVGTFSNGQNVDLAQVVLDKVENPEGLEKVGSGYYVSSVNSGSNHLGLAGTLGLGTVQGSALEGSNVDLTVELSNMIVAQRGFEANARIFSTLNGTLQTLGNLGR